MIDLRRWRDDPDYRAGAIRKGLDPAVADNLTAADAAHREALVAAEQARAAHNAASREIGQADPAERPAKIEAAAATKAHLETVEAAERDATEQLNALVLAVPNPAHSSVPAGDESAFELVREVGERTAAPAHDHAALGEMLDWVNSATAAKHSGTRFAYLRREAVLLQFALMQWTMTKLVGHNFIPVVPPVLVREQLMVDAGFFPTDRHQVYEIAGDDLFLTGTSEVALAGLHADERLAVSSLPLRYAGYSSCFRREAGTHGKDTRGIFRVHQFDKVEMFSFVHPDDSWNELERLRDIQEELVGGLGLPYRVINVAAGDLGAAAAKKYDLEVWLPSEGTYREITSCSNYTDYSARRLGTRCVTDDRDGRAELVHTLNGTACAIGRTLVFLLENAQQPDGSIVVPEALRPYCGLEVIAPPQ